MNKTLRVPSDAEGKFALRFPDRCIYCGQPAEKIVEWNITFTGSGKEKGVKYSTTQQVPFCARHERESKFLKSVDNFLYSFCALVGLAICVWLFISYIDIAPGIVGGKKLSLLLSFLTGFVAFMVMAILLQLGWHRLRPSAEDRLDLLGVGAEFAPDGRHLDVTFTNEMIAAEFAKENPGSEELAVKQAVPPS
jgi:hypothetical protein